MKKGSRSGYDAETGEESASSESALGEPYEQPSLYRIRRSQKSHRIKRGQTGPAPLFFPLRREDEAILAGTSDSFLWPADFSRGQRPLRHPFQVRDKFLRTQRPSRVRILSNAG